MDVISNEKALPILSGLIRRQGTLKLFLATLKFRIALPKRSAGAYRSLQSDISFAGWL